jgi:hypothetical protein
MTIPKLWGPPLFPVQKQVCFLQNEDGFDLFLLENGSGFIQLETCLNQPVGTYLFELENGTGTIRLENGGGSLELEIGP